MRFSLSPPFISGNHQDHPNLEVKPRGGVSTTMGDRVGSLCNGGFHFLFFFNFKTDFHSPVVSSVFESNLEFF